MKERIKDKLSIDNFLKRIDKNLCSYEEKTFIEEVISNYFLIDNDSKYEKDFFKELLSEGSGKTSNKLIRNIIRSKLFQEWFEQFIENKVKNFIEKLTFDKKNIIIYRAITAKYDYIEKVKNINSVKLGNCWTYKYEGAIPYNGCPSEDTYIFHGKTSISSVNWYKTFMLNIIEIYGEDEMEIRLFDNKKIKDLTIEKEDYLFHFRFKNKKFKS
jgi:hypothetical protein